MKYLEFRKAMLPFQVFSTRDVEKQFPGFDSRRLFEWSRKRYLIKLVNKWYLFSECEIDEQLLFRISNCICRPSYISLESALAYYHLIPEAVYTQTGVTTKKTIRYETEVGNFEFHNMKPNLFFGYDIRRNGNFPVLIAEMEKAILDFLYLNTSLKTESDIEQIRFNYVELQHSLDNEKLGNYQAIFASKTLDKKVKYLQIQMNHAEFI